ncbi:hypothetical protein FS749_002185 [Ceratobasidium sp. UAMH 11750]|nr:hypothetical protein FS749_002185 [Ceratobasidium sp. UAMH 11750]
MKARLDELRLSNDEQALRTWMKAQQAELEGRKKHGDAVAGFLNAIHQAKMDELKRNWNERIESKLLELGYTQKVEDLPPHKQSRWRSFFDKTDVLTDQKWGQLRHAMVGFLETEAMDRIERERHQRRLNRDDRLSGLFNSVRYVMGTIPEAPESLSIAEATTVVAKWIPPPDYDDALEWPIIRHLLETDRTVEEMADCFEKRRHEIIQSIEDWGRKVKREWASILREGRKKDGLALDPPRPRLYESEADVDPFKNMGADTCLLLRADSIFDFNFKGRRHTAAPSALTYDMLALHLSPGGQSSDGRNSGTLDLMDYTWHSKASLFARALLRAMGREDASIIEFHASKNPQYMTCGRCGIAGSFLSVVFHYVREASKWEGVQEHLPVFARHGIAYNYVHDPESNNPKPLLGNNVSADEAEVIMEKLLKNSQSSNNRFKCRLCERGMPKSPFFYDIDILSSHLIDVHDILDPLSGGSGEPESVENSPYIRLCAPHEGRVYNLGPGLTVVIGSDYGH